MADDRYDAGMRVRRRSSATSTSTGRAAATTPLDADFQRFITEMAWGSVWTRDDQLDRRTRSCVTIALLTALRRGRAGDAHPRRAAQRAHPDEIAEVIMHTAVYAGIPAANRRCAWPRTSPTVDAFPSECLLTGSAAGV